MSSSADANAIKSRMEARGKALAAASAAPTTTHITATSAQQQPNLYISPQIPPHVVTTTHTTAYVPTTMPPPPAFPSVPSSSSTAASLRPITNNTINTPNNNSSITNNNNNAASISQGNIDVCIVDNGATCKPSVSAASLQSLERCRSLRERLNERSASAALHAASAAESSLPISSSHLTLPWQGLGRSSARREEVEEPTRDVYAHALPFPKAAVLEVERVTLNDRCSPHADTATHIVGGGGRRQAPEEVNDRVLVSPLTPSYTTATATASAPFPSSTAPHRQPYSQQPLSDAHRHYTLGPAAVGYASDPLSAFLRVGLSSSSTSAMGGADRDTLRSNASSPPPPDKAVLLMASECAEVVRDLQQRLEAEARRSADVTTVLRTLEGDLAREQHARGEAERERQQWAERHAALEAVYNMEKRRWTEAVRSERDMGVAAGNEALEKLSDEYKELVEVARTEAEAYKTKAEKLKFDNDRLEHVLRELKEQMSANAALATTSGTSVDRLTKELLLAKQQTNFISVGYKKQDAELRILREQVEKQAAELAQLRAIASEHAILVAQRNEANIRLEAMQREAAEVPRLRAELASLRESHAKLTIEYDEKSSKAAELKEILDDIRRQASNAYIQTMGFNTMAEALSPARGVGGGAAVLNDGLGLGAAMTGPNLPYNQQPLPQSIALMQAAEVERLRHEIEAEQRRAEEDKRRWRERLETSSAATAAGGSSR